MEAEAIAQNVQKAFGNARNAHVFASIALGVNVLLCGYTFYGAYQAHTRYEALKERICQRHFSEQRHVELCKDDILRP